MAAENTQDFKELSQKVMSANKDHQYALKVYTERLQSELDIVDKLLASADQPEADFEGDLGGSIAIPGAAKAVGPVPHGIIYEESPFAEDAAKRQRYLKSTVIHPMKAIEIEALSDAVRSENHRLFALEAQRRGHQPFVAVDEHPPGFFHINKSGLNWERIASKVSDAGVNYVQRSAQECEIRWLGDKHPEFNHADWSQEEIARAVELVGTSKEGEVDWVEIAAKLGTNRTPIDCMRHAIQRKAHVWTPEADERLLEAVRIYGLENWQQVARQVSEDATSSQCQNRYTRTVDPNIKRGPWTEKEDALLRNAVSVFGRSWMEVCVWVPGRNNEQCRERHQELEKTTKQRQWTEAEDEALLEAYKTVGGPRWVEVAKILGRTNSMCRHRYATLMKRKAKEATEPDLSSPGGSDLPPIPEEPAAGPSKSSKSAPKRRANQTHSKGMKDPPESDKNEDSAPARHEPKPKPRPRAKRAASKPKQQGHTETDAGTSRGSTEHQTSDPQPNVDTASWPPVTVEEKSSQGISSGNAETSVIDGPKSTAPVGPPPKRGRGRPRKSTLARPAPESPENERATKKRRVASDEDTQLEDNAGAQGATPVAEESATKLSPKRRGKTRKPVASTSKSNDTSAILNNANVGEEGEGGDIDGVHAKSSQTVDLSSPLRRSARVRRPTQT